MFEEIVFLISYYNPPSSGFMSWLVRQLKLSGLQKKAGSFGKASLRRDQEGLCGTSISFHTVGFLSSSLASYLPWNHRLLLRPTVRPSLETKHNMGSLYQQSPGDTTLCSQQQPKECSCLCWGEWCPWPYHRKEFQAGPEWSKANEFIDYLWRVIKKKTVHNTKM